MMLNFKKCEVQTVLVHTGTYSDRYVLIQTASTNMLLLNHALPAFRRWQVSNARLTRPSSGLLGTVMTCSAVHLSQLNWHAADYIWVLRYTASGTYWYVLVCTDDIVCTNNYVLACTYVLIYTCIQCVLVQQEFRWSRRFLYVHRESTSISGMKPSSRAKASACVMLLSCHCWVHTCNIIVVLTSTYEYVLVLTSMFRYLPVHTGIFFVYCSLYWYLSCHRIAIEWQCN